MNYKMKQRKKTMFYPATIIVFPSNDIDKLEKNIFATPLRLCTTTYLKILSNQVFKSLKKVLFPQNEDEGDLEKYIYTHIYREDT